MTTKLWPFFTYVYANEKAILTFLCDFPKAIVSDNFSPLAMVTQCL